MVDQVSDFVLTMTNSANQVELTYAYTVQATAEGGSSATTSGVMIVGKACVAELNPYFELNYYFDLPEYGNENVSFP